MLLTALVLLPAAGLFLRVLQENSQQRDTVQLEQDGVEYLTVLGPLVSALAESQASALQGVAAEPASVTAAVARVQGVDGRLGDALETHSRWSDLKDKIAKLPKVTGTSEQIFTAHVEAADLAVELFDVVRENSRLNRDPEADVSFLQEVVGQLMPEAVTFVSRMSDYANMVPAARTKADKAKLTVQFGYQALKVQETVAKLTDSLQEAVESTKSTTLSGNLVSNLDSFRRGIEAANRGANIGGAPNVSTLVTAQSTLQTALSALSGVVLKEMSGRLDDRSSSLTYKRIEAFGLLGIAIVLIVVATLWTRGRARQVQATLVEPGQGSRDVSVRAGTSVPAGNPTGSPYDSIPNYGDTPNYGGGRERSGALR
ncbi:MULTISPECIES: hypothetical protein [unclassified Actinoplanes]|uniref:hypothetical protein n=1 Tax=unclassified Actinoplanes TaxID=2626549 RepID=UPI0005B8CAAF|nr:MULTISPECIES: hypothetical protein [unclassified Actinoplanes]